MGMRPVILVLALLAAGCGSSPNTPGKSGNVSGTWTGTYSSAQLGPGTATLNLVQSGAALSGTWSTTPTVVGRAPNSGTVSGTNAGTNDSGTFTIDLAPSNPATCPFRATMTYFLMQAQMTGDFVTTNCTVAASGGLILHKAF